MQAAGCPGFVGLSSPLNSRYSDYRQFWRFLDFQHTFLGLLAAEARKTILGYKIVTIRRLPNIRLQ